MGLRTRTKTYSLTELVPLASREWTTTLDQTKSPPVAVTVMSGEGINAPYLGTHHFKVFTDEDPLITRTSRSACHVASKLEVHDVHKALPVRITYPEANAVPRVAVDIAYAYHASDFTHVLQILDERRLVAEREASERLWDTIPKLWGELTKSDFDAAVFLAEAKDLKDLYTSVVAKGTKQYWKLRGSTIKSKDEYLNQQLAMQPFLSDVTAVAQQIAEFVENLDFKTQVIHEKVVRRLKVDDSTDITVTFPYNVDFGCKLRVNYQIDVKAKYFLTFSDYLETRGTGGFGTFTSRMARMNLANTDVMVLWDLIPYSFVLDYITNIGDVLDMLTSSPPRGVVRHGTSITSKVFATYEILDGSIIAPPHWTTYEASHPKVIGSLHREYWERFPGPPPKPSVLDFFTFQWPSPIQVVTMAALFVPKSTLERAERAARRAYREHRKNLEHGYTD